LPKWKLNLYILLVTQLMVTMSINFGAPFIPYFIQDMGITEPDKVKLYSAISATAPAVGMGLFAPFWGMLADRHGKKLMMLRAIMMSSIIYVGLGLSTNVSQLLVLRFFQGAFTGTVAASNAFIASNIPEDELSFSFGALSSSKFLGMTLGPAVGGLIAEALGFRISFFVGGAMMFLNALSVLIFLSEKKVIAEKTTKYNNPFASIGIIFKPVLATVLIMILLIAMSRIIFKPFIPLFVQEIRGTIEGSSGITGIISAVIAIVTAIAGVAAGRIADKKGKFFVIRYALITGIFISCILLFAKGLVMFTILYSMTMFAIGGLEPVLFSIASSRVEQEKRGTLFGYITMLSASGWAVASGIGSIISIQISIRAILGAIPVFLVLMLIMHIRAPYRSRV